MSFKRFDQEDIVISAEAITAPAWTGNEITLQSFFTSSTQEGGTSGGYYINVYNKDITDSSAAIQFSIAYGNKVGSGSAYINDNVVSNTPSSIIYKQYRNLINGTEETDLSFAGTSIQSIYAISIERARYKEKILPGSLSLTIARSGGDLKLTDDSEYTTTQTFTDAGRVFNIISGSAGVRSTGTGTDGTYGYSKGSGSYGLLLPDAGLILLNGDALDESVGANGGAALGTVKTANNTGTSNHKLLINKIIDGGSFTLRSEETVSSNYVFVRARNSEFNYSTNPSNITGSGELRHDIMIDTPQSYITTVGLYNDNNDLLAVAKLSRPLLKDFTKEALVRIKLDY